MCIAIIKPANFPLPPESHFRHSFEINDDGAGIAYPTKEGVVYVKGLMTYKMFSKTLSRIASKIDLVHRPVFFHFRIGTHGKTKDPAHTHPFPITSSYEEMEKTTGLVESIMMHNGILSDFALHPSTASDTMVFNAEILADLKKMGKGWLDSEATNKLLEYEVGHFNKIAVLNSDGTWAKWGKWAKDKDSNCYYSNETYCATNTFYYGGKRFYYDKDLDRDEGFGWTKDDNLVPANFGFDESTKTYRLPGPDEAKKWDVSLGRYVIVKSRRLDTFPSPQAPGIVIPYIYEEGQRKIPARFQLFNGPSWEHVPPTYVVSYRNNVTQPITELFKNAYVPPQVFRSRSTGEIWWRNDGDNWSLLVFGKSDHELARDKKNEVVPVVIEKKETRDDEVEV